ncbi:MAG: homoserine O-succinyltransferase [Turicibacter sp.]|nr:homoserine O-succinyltransferase [Turicibacter sp.]
MIVLDKELPVVKELRAEGVRVEVSHGEVAIRVAIVNLMPSKATTELQLLRLLGKDGRPVKVDFIRMESHQSKLTEPGYLNRFYKSLTEIKGAKYDGLIITGAPVETLDFDKVTYWQELAGLMDWSLANVEKVLYICWGAQAGLYHHFGIGKRTLGKKISGVFSHKLAKTWHPYLNGLKDGFKVPHSRWTELDEAGLRLNKELEVLAYSKEAGSHMVTDASKKHLFLLGHPEYDADTLANEYFRDLKKGANPQVPTDYFPDDDPGQTPALCWGEAGGILIKNWLAAMKGRVQVQAKKNFPSEFDAKKLICEIGKRVYDKNFVAANDGNISVKIGPDTIITTPTGVSKGFMTPDMLVKMDLSGKVLAGRLKPSSEVKMHLRVYKENPNVGAVVHAHPPVATSYAIAGIPLDKPISPEAVVLLGTVPVAPYATPGTEEVPDSVAPYCRGHNALLLANHGALTWGEDLLQAYYRMESLEHYALMTMYTGNIIQNANELDCNQVTDLIKIREGMGIKTGGTPSCQMEAKPEAAISKEEAIQEVVRQVTANILEAMQQGG